MTVRVKFRISNPVDRGVSVDWDHTGSGDYATTSMAFLAVAMGDSDFREKVCEMKFGPDWRTSTTYP